MNDNSNLPTGVTQDHEEFNPLEIRYKKCEFCEGTGKVKENDYEETLHKCEDCHGIGEVEMTNEDIVNELEKAKEYKSNL